MRLVVQWLHVARGITSSRLSRTSLMSWQPQRLKSVFSIRFFRATQVRTVTKLTKSYETNSTTVSGIFWWFQLFVGVINVICLACIPADAKATFPANSIYPCLDEQLLAGYNHLSSWGFAKCCWIFSSPRTYFSIVRLSGYQNRFVVP